MADDDNSVMSFGVSFLVSSSSIRDWASASGPRCETSWIVWMSTKKYSLEWIIEDRSRHREAEKSIHRIKVCVASTSFFWVFVFHPAALKQNNTKQHIPLLIGRFYAWWPFWHDPPYLSGPRNDWFVHPSGSGPTASFVNFAFQQYKTLEHRVPVTFYFPFDFLLFYQYFMWEKRPYENRTRQHRHERKYLVLKYTTTFPDPFKLHPNFISEQSTSRSVTFHQTFGFLVFIFNGSHQMLRKHLSISI